MLTSNEFACLLQIREPNAKFLCDFLLERLEFLANVFFARYWIVACVAVEANKEFLLGKRRRVAYRLPVARISDRGS